MYQFKCPKCSSLNLTIRGYVWCHVDQSDVDGRNITVPSAIPGDWEIDADWDNGVISCEDCQNQGPAHRFRINMPANLTAIEAAGPQIREPERQSLR